MNGKPRILFVSHAATRNGATILLLNTLRWLRANSDFEIEILVHGTGDLLDEFKAVGRTTVLRNSAFFLESLPRGMKASLKPKVESLWLNLLMIGRKFDLVYFNTSAVAANVPVLSSHAKRMLWHIHELDYALQLTMGEAMMRELFPRMDRFVVVSSSVQETLRKFGVQQGRMDLIHGSVPVGEFTPEDRSVCRRKVLEQLGWPEDSFVVGACGGMGWRKGTDLFLQIARHIRGGISRDKFRFLWIGGAMKGEEALRFAHDVRLFGLEKQCCSIPTTGNVMDYYQAMDVFALTSREDPFPLVMLEAGACRVPTVCFAESGGGPEYVGTDAGLIAPYLDVAAFATHLELLQASIELRHRMGDAAARKVRAGHVIETQGPKILASIQKAMALRGGEA